VNDNNIIADRYILCKSIYDSLGFRQGQKIDLLAWSSTADNIAQKISSKAELN